MTFKWPVKQIAYLVNDVREAALRHSAHFGSGPFFVIDYPPIPVSTGPSTTAM